MAKKRKRKAAARTVTPANPVAAGLPPPPGYPGQAYPPHQAGSALPPQASVQITPPPERTRNPFVNAQVLYQQGGQMATRIVGVRNAGPSSFNPQQKGWFLDLENGYTARVNEGDVRHQFLYGRFQANWIGQQVTLRITQPSDNTRAHWVFA